jgi:6-phosphogluconate dehydrogenase
MEIGFIGLGKMGGNMVERLLIAGHKVTVFNRSQDKIDTAVLKGAVGSTSVKDLTEKLETRKTNMAYASFRQHNR